MSECTDLAVAVDGLFDREFDLFYIDSGIGGQYECRVCGHEATDYNAMTHADYCPVGKLERAMNRMEPES